MTVTLIFLLKRRDGMSKADFITYYEDHHRRVGEQVLGGYATRYVRRFLFPGDGEDQPGDFDVVTEMDFPDAATHDACFAASAAPATMAMIVEDEARFLDRSRTRRFTVEERQSDLPPVRGI
ncbi:MAG: EthD domain-containing protein [Novosphingobium sp.]